MKALANSRLCPREKAEIQSEGSHLASRCPHRAWMLTHPWGEGGPKALLGNSWEVQTLPRGMRGAGEDWGADWKLDGFLLVWRELIVLDSTFIGLYKKNGRTSTKPCF